MVNIFLSTVFLVLLLSTTHVPNFMFIASQSGDMGSRQNNPPPLGATKTSKGVILNGDYFIVIILSFINSSKLFNTFVYYSFCRICATYFDKNVYISIELNIIHTRLLLPFKLLLVSDLLLAPVLIILV